MFYIPMVFMLIVTICSLIQTIMAKLALASAGGVEGTWAAVQAGIAVLLVVLAIILAITSFRTLAKEKAEKHAGSAA